MLRKCLCAVFCPALLCGALSASADDVIGVVRVDAPSGAAVEVAVPFEPLGSARIADFLSGGFVGDGGGDSDRLWHVSSRDGSVTVSVFSNGVWVGAADGSSSAARVPTAGVELSVGWHALRVVVPSEDVDGADLDWSGLDVARRRRGERRSMPTTRRDGAYARIRPQGLSRLATVSGTGCSRRSRTRTAS